MPRDPKYDVLFEPVQIGPVTAPNRFFQETPTSSGSASPADTQIRNLAEPFSGVHWGSASIAA